MVAMLWSKFGSLLLVIFHVGPTLARINGASSSRCSDMLLGTGLRPQNSDLPVHIQPNQISVRIGDTVTFELKSSSPNLWLEQFMVQVRRKNFEEDQTPVGLMSIPPGFESLVETEKCPHDGLNLNVVTNVHTVQTQSVEFEWTAPSEPGAYVFLCSVTQSAEFYWTKKICGTIHVSSGGQRFRRAGEGSCKPLY